MALILNQQVDTSLPIEVPGICPDQLAGLNESDIAKLPIGFGNRDVPLSEIFGVSGNMLQSEDDVPTIRWTGNLKSVHWLGAKMGSGRMVIESSAGRHIGSQMSSGEIVVNGDVSDQVGAEMTGGTIRVAGNAGDLVGANYPGSKFGMNRGEIFIMGNADKGVGQRMRRGTIVIGGDCGTLAGWDMLAGTIVVLGHCQNNVGLNMSRGTIVLANPDPSKTDLLPTFTPGGTNTVPVIRLLAKWIRRSAPDLDVSRLIENRFTQYHGDAAKSSRGEIFVMANL